MDITPLISTKNSVIQSYGANGFKISGTHYQGAVLVTPTKVVPWDKAALDSISARDLNEEIKKCDVLFIGTGKEMQHLSPQQRDEFKNNKINVETMDTGAACRTFNVLMSDGRNIAALLFVPDA
jgi:uncharacterized protein